MGVLLGETVSILFAISFVMVFVSGFKSGILSA